MAQFNADLLALARIFRGKSQADIAAMSGLNQGHYSRIENGLLPDGPQPENVDRIAAALNFPAAFFYQSDDVAGLPISVHPMNRKKASVGERALKQAHAELNLRLIHLRRYLGAVELEAELPLPWLDVDEVGGPASVAKIVRRAWMLPTGPIRNLTECCERAGILVVWCDFSAAIDGVTMRVRDLPTCIFLNRNVTADRMRFSLAHELGHIIMHRVPTDDIEDEANAFAGELLVPENELTQHVIGNKITLEFLARQKAFWKTSMAFILFRIGKLGLATRHQTEYLWKQISSKGWRLREPIETDVSFEEPSVFPKMIRLHANDLGYNLQGFSDLVHFSADDVSKFYGDHMRSDGKPRLSIVR